MRGGVALVLLLAGSAWGSVTATAPRGIGCVRGVNDAAVCAREVSAAPSGAEGSIPVDWSGSFNGIWRLEEDGANSGSCGTNCALTSTAGTVIHEPTAAYEGYSGWNIRNGAGRRSCADATCGSELDGDGATAISFGCMVRVHAVTNARTLVSNFASGSNGYTASVDTSRKLVCSIGASPDVTLTSTGTLTLERWTAVGCSFSAIGAPVLEGTADGAGAQGNPAADAAIFALSASGGTTTWDGDLDLCWLRKGALSTAQFCRIAMCGITGTEFGCTCSGAGTGLASYAQRGRYDSAGMTCTPSDCTAAAP